jgi:hypothetical protein
MAICSACKQDMGKHVSCTLKKYTDKKNPRIPYDRGEDGNCHDCGTPNGSLHHPGCDMERCADCHGQAISCDCDPPETNVLPQQIDNHIVLTVLKENDSLCLSSSKERLQLALVLSDGAVIWE